MGLVSAGDWLIIKKTFLFLSCCSEAFFCLWAGQQMLDDFSVKFDEKDKVANPAAGDLFETGNGEFLAENFKKEFHTFVAKGLFLCGRARPDTKQVISVLSSRVKSPNQDDWDKLVRLMGFCTQQSWMS